MKNDPTYKEKFSQLRPWMESIVETIKKDLKNEHLKADLRFYKKHFAGKAPNKLAISDLVEAYSKELVDEGNEPLAEFVSNRWLIKKGEVYQLFAEHLTKINPNFDEIEEIDAAKSREIVKSASDAFGPLDTYIFSILNSVVFSPQVIKELEEHTKKTKNRVEAEQRESEDKATLEKAVRTHELEMARVVDKYEKKLSGLQKKYIDDTAALKKQIAALQRKLAPEMCTKA